MNLLCCYYLFLRRRPHLEAVTSRLFSSFCTCLCLGIGWEVGVEVLDSILLSFLKLADDIVLFEHLWSDTVLVCVLEQRCWDFPDSGFRHKN